ncbi:hypothetical protein D3C80_816100 [compost metagenome]
MIDALVKLVMHPGANAVAGQKIGGPRNQILEVEQATPSLQLLVILGQPRRQRQRRLGCRKHPDQPQPVTAGKHMVARRIDRRRELRRWLQHRLGNQRTVGLDRALGGQKDRFQIVGPLERIQLLHHHPQAIGDIGHLGSTTLVGQRQIEIEGEARQPRKRPVTSGDTFFRIARIKPQHPLECGSDPFMTLRMRCETPDRRAVGHDVGKQRLQPELVTEIEHMRKGFRQLGVVFGRGSGEKRSPGLCQKC